MHRSGVRKNFKFYQTLYLLEHTYFSDKKLCKKEKIRITEGFLV